MPDLLQKGFASGLLPVQSQYLYSELTLRGNASVIRQMWVAMCKITNRYNMSALLLLHQLSLMWFRSRPGTLLSAYGALMTGLAESVLA